MATLLLAAPAWAGDAVRGRAIVVTRERGLCLLCHSGPFAEERFQGDIGPTLSGVGSRLTEAQLRQIITNPRLLNPATPMPAYGQTDGLSHVAKRFANKPILTPDEIEDVVAFLVTLKTP